MTKRLTIALVALAMFVLIAAMPASASYIVVNPFINHSATVFIGEQGLDLTPAYNYFNTGSSTSGGFDTALIGWWPAGSNTMTTPAVQTFPISSYTNVLMAPTTFSGYTGNWYARYTNGSANTTFGAFFIVADPQLSVDIWDINQGTQGGISVSGASVVQGDNLTFKIGNAMYTAIATGASRYNAVTDQTPATTGWADIEVKNDQGSTFNQLLNVSNQPNILTSQKVNSASWFWGTTTNGGAADLNWSTAATDATGQLAYPAGTYTVVVKSKMNGMYDNYLNGGAAYTGKTVSAAQTVTLVSNTVKITANKDTVVRSKPFSVTITGRPNTQYHVWVKGTSMMSGAFDNQPPMIAPYQAGVVQDTNATTVGDGYMAIYNLVAYATDSAATANAGGYEFQNGGYSASTGYGTGTVWADVAKGTSSDATRFKLGNGTALYANVTTLSSGTRTVEFVTTNWTKAQKYTIRVENKFGSAFKSDEVDVKVEKGAVTIVAAGDQSYYLGEEVKFSGTNTETQTTYLMITGPNLQPKGSDLSDSNPRSDGAAVSASDPSSYTTASVLGDNTWSYKWGTANVALDAGTYTVWALSGPAEANSATQLNTVSYGTVSIVIKKPFISATASQSTVAQGDKVIITGVAEGSPSVGVQIWVLGKNYATVAQKAVNSDATFSYEVSRADTKNLAPGQYFVVAQHPMQNNKFDIYRGTGSATDSAQNGGSNYVFNLQLITAGSSSTVGTKVFNLLGAGSLQGSDAAEALVQAINDPNVDDTYTKLQFLIENPTITITPVGDRHVGDKFTIAATTNMAVDDEVLCQVYSSSFKPTQKSQSGEFSGTSGTVKVTKGTSGLNAISFSVDASTFKPDEYIVQESGVIVSATGTALFNILEGAAPTAVPTVVVTTAAPTTVATTVAPTTVAPTKTPTQPGFGALVALVGLGAVALLVVRRH